MAEADLILHVVDGWDADPRAQIAAVREVLGEIGAGEVPELVVINKADEADPIEVEGLRLAERAQSWWSRPAPGAGWTTCSASSRPALPRRDTRGQRAGAVRPRRPGVPRAPGGRGARRRGTAQDGTELTARVPPGLAAELGRLAAPAASS